MSPTTAVRDRYSFANLDEVLDLPDLIAIQRASFEWFLHQGLAETFRDISPIKDFTETLQLELEFDADDVAAESGGHYGLLGMQERTHQAGGQLSITTHPGGGTAVEVVIPVTSGK